MPTDCSSDAIKDIFYQKPHDLLHTARCRDIAILAGNMRARVGRLSSNVAHLGGSFSIDYSRFGNEEQLQALCSDHQLFPVSTSFRR